MSRTSVAAAASGGLTGLAASLAGMAGGASVAGGVPVTASASRSTATAVCPVVGRGVCAFLHPHNMLLVMSIAVLGCVFLYVWVVRRTLKRWDDQIRAVDKTVTDLRTELMVTKERLATASNNTRSTSDETGGALPIPVMDTGYSRDAVCNSKGTAHCAKSATTTGTATTTIVRALINKDDGFYDDPNHDDAAEDEYDDAMIVDDMSVGSDDIRRLFRSLADASTHPTNPTAASLMVMNMSASPLSKVHRATVEEIVDDDDMNTTIVEKQKDDEEEEEQEEEGEEGEEEERATIETLMGEEKEDEKEEKDEKEKGELPQSSAPQSVDDVALPPLSSTPAPTTPAFRASSSSSTMIQTMKYEELRRLAKESGIDSRGTKDMLVARLLAASSSSSAAPPSS